MRCCWSKMGFIRGRFSVLCDKSAKRWATGGGWQGRVDFALPVRLCNEHIQFSFLPRCSAYGTESKSGPSNIDEDRGCCHVMFTP
jgi:hypothetical protein